MKSTSHIFAKGILLVFLVLPVFAHAQSAALSESAYRALLLQLIASLQQQIVLLQQQLQAQQATVKEVVVLGESGALSGSVDVMAAYAITTPGSVSSISDPEHRAYFKRVFELYPDAYDPYLGKVAVYAEESSDFDAFVETLPPRHEKWLYAVNERMLEDIESKWNTELIVHELAHIISYETFDGQPRSTGEKCVAYFERHGCPDQDSYLALFVNEFWDTSDLVRAGRFADANDGYESAYDYYDDHVTEYVSDYASVAPEEDFAESFMYFILEEMPTGKVAKQKVNFFGQFASMNKMRSEIKAVK